MTRERWFWLAVALLSIGALGVSATTMESTVTTEPDDVIDPDYDTVPIGADDAQKVLDEMASEDAESGDRRDASAPEDGTEEEMRSESSESSDSAESQASPDVVPPEPSLLERLLDLLATLIPFLLFVATVLGSAGLTVRYRDQILGFFEDSDPPTPQDDPASPFDDWLDGPPSNAVDRAWVALVEELDLERPTTMTPRECATAAVDAGFDREAVARLTETFEEVRYGGQPATDHREELAHSSRRQLDLEEVV